MALRAAAAHTAASLHRIAMPCLWHSGDEWALNDERTVRFGVMPGSKAVRRIFPDRSYSFVADFATRSAARAEAARLNRRLADLRASLPHGERNRAAAQWLVERLSEAEL